VCGGRRTVPADASGRPGRTDCPAQGVDVNASTNRSFVGAASLGSCKRGQYHPTRPSPPSGPSEQSRPAGHWDKPFPPPSPASQCLPPRRLRPPSRPSAFSENDCADRAVEQSRGAANRLTIPGYDIKDVPGPRGAWASSTRRGQIRLNRLVALKMMLAGHRCGPGRAGPPSRSEAEAVARLQHPLQSCRYTRWASTTARPYFFTGIPRRWQPR